MDLNRLPLTVFEEIGNYLDLKSFIALISLSKGIRDKVLSSNIKIRGIDLFFAKFAIEKDEHKLYKTYQSYFTDIKVKILSNSDKFVCKTIDNISDVYALDLSNCQSITDISLKKLSVFKNLQVLNLTRCYDITYRDIKLPSLRSLNLSGCLLKLSNDAIAESLALTHVNLESLYLSRISDQGAKALGRLTNLRNLYLSYCDNITDEGAEALASSLVKLERLKLQSSITDQGVKAIASLTNLQSLNLSGSNITKKGVETIACSLFSLEVLNLSDCKNIDGLPNEFGNIKSLWHLNLSGCHNIDDSSFKALTLLTSLHTLNISSCDTITKETYEMLKNLDIPFFHSNSIFDDEYIPDPWI